MLVDRGLFQGFRQLRLRNWDPSPIATRTIRTVILNQSHLDNSASLRLLALNGRCAPR